jgi:Zn-dependent alcohol dehydrogenase
MPSGHGYCGIVEEVGSAVRFVKPGQFQPDNPEVVVTAYEGGTSTLDAQSATTFVSH